MRFQVGIVVLQSGGYRSHQEHCIMIGVVANPSDYAVVREFFELFKTPWEFVRSDQQYDVLLCDGSIEVESRSSKVILLYAGQELPRDFGVGNTVQRSNCRLLAHKDVRIPIYGNSLLFSEKAPGLLVDAESQAPASYIERVNGSVLARVGYDLFREIRTLLSVGQPASDAAIPSLELHIALMRDLIVTHGAPLVEIPPVPEGFKFIACLTHDIDHPSIRLHKFDHTMFGFLYRALFRSLFNLVTGRGTLSALLRNWGAAWKLPFVYLGLAKDCWREFERYLDLEAGHRSSFFVIPFKGERGRLGHGLAPKRRAAAYGLADIESQIKKLQSAGCEVGLHGVDAWRDSTRGHEELQEIQRLTGKHDIGVRMHWLYFDGQSPVALEKAGADYDSTVGFNETVGYRAGTTQVYKPFGTTRLLELPLHIMDTALFYPSYLNLAPREAAKQVGGIIANAVRFGGCVTVNWHDRSIVPERCWDDFYVEIINEFKSHGAWFATASETVSWFRKRRLAKFDHITEGAGILGDGETTDSAVKLPGLQLLIHDPQKSEEVFAMAESFPSV